MGSRREFSELFHYDQVYLIDKPVTVCLRSMLQACGIDLA